MGIYRMIRPDLLKAVHDTLAAHSYLALEDFTLSEYANKENQACLSIQYRYDRELLFKFHIPTQRTKGEFGTAYRFHSTMRPGKEAVEETLFAEERHGLLAELKAWMDRLYADVIAVPAQRRFQEHARAIDELTARFNSLPDEPLSQADIQAFQAGLENLQNDISEQLKENSKDKEELRRRISELTSDIGFLKATLESLSKRQWAELFAARMERWRRSFSLRHLSAGTRVAKLLMPGDGGGLLGDVADALDGVVDATDSEGGSGP